MIRRVLCSVLVMVMMFGCATTSSLQTKAVDSTVPPVEQKADDGVKWYEVAGAIILLPVYLAAAGAALLFLAASSPGAYSSSVHCYTYTYKDQYHTKCY